MRGNTELQATGPSPRHPRAASMLLLATLTALLWGCGAPEGAEPAEAESVESQQSALESQPVGLALEVVGGEGVALQVRAGQTFYVNQLDLRTALPTSVAEGIQQLRTNTQESDFTSLDWEGLTQADEETSVTPDFATGLYTRRRFYRNAAWMRVPSTFTVEPVDAQGNPTGRAVTLRIGSEKKRRDSDSFFVRRLRAIHTTFDCVTRTDCTGADQFQEEALVELRHARTSDKARRRTFTLAPSTTALRLHWSLRPGAPYTIPVQQVAQPTYAYGFGIDLTPITPPGPDGTYAPGTDITFRVTLKDGAGQRLHPEGSLPTYQEFLDQQLVGAELESGIQYYRGFAFLEPTTTYYRRKHREAMLATHFIGPAHHVQPIRSITGIGDFLAPGDVIPVGLPERDGVFAAAGTLPTTNTVFAGIFNAPVSDTWTVRLPANAQPGTYTATVKARRRYLGEDVPVTRHVEVQVGTPEHTSPTLTTGKCGTCHTDGGELSAILHGNSNRAACAGCHTPLGFELEGPLFVRLHFIHSRSEQRVGEPLHKCATCHLGPETIQRTSKAACLSCHKSYPESHVQRFGPIQSMYVGGGEESFQQCTGACHSTHPGSGF
jgi:hypothetical protein